MRLSDLMPAKRKVSTWYGYPGTLITRIGVPPEKGTRPRIRGLHLKKSGCCTTRLQRILDGHNAYHERTHAVGTNHDTWNLSGIAVSRFDSLIIDY